MKYRATDRGLYLNGRSYAPGEPIALEEPLAARLLVAGEIELDISPMIATPAEAREIDATPRNTVAESAPETTATTPRRGRPPRSR